MEEITWQDFEKIELRIGTIIEAKVFTGARKPAYQLKIVGHYGIKKSSAQLTQLYTPESLLGKQILGVINFPDKQIGKFRSECLVTGFADEQGAIVLASVEMPVPNGSKLI